MERTDREVVGRGDGAHDAAAIASLPGFLAAALLPASGEVELDADAAHHMRVRRIGEGETVRVTDGAGRIARAEVASVGKRGAVVALHWVRDVEAASPPVHLLAPVADRERMLWLAEKATELGASSWRAVAWRRSKSVSPRGEGESFRAKVRARMTSALLQSGGAWLPGVEPDVPLDRLPGVIPEGALAAGALAVLLDAAGEPLLDLLGRAAPATEGVYLAVGPEGGVEADERAHLLAAGFRPASLGGSILRFETAGVAALALAGAALRAGVAPAIARP